MRERSRAPPLRAARNQGDEAGLRQVLLACDQAGVARQAMLLRRSRLPRELMLPHVLARLRDTVEPLLHADRAQEFTLPNTDIVVVWRGDAAAAVQASQQAARYFCIGRRLPPDPPMTECFALPADRAALERVLDRAHLLAAALPEPDGEGRRSLDLPALLALETQLAHADLSRFVRRRDVCAVDAEARFALRWEKRVFALTELAAAVAPDRALRADPWLYRRLSQALERRMLALLAIPGELREAAPFAIGLGAQAILSGEFLRFDAALPHALRGQVTLGLPAADVLADPQAFRFAREFARARAYRLLLRAAAPAHLAALPPARTGLEAVQVAWSPLLAETGLGDTPPDCVVVAGVDSREALAWGAALGVGAFCGPLVARDQLAPGVGPAAPEGPGLSRTRALGEASAAA